MKKLLFLAVIAVAVWFALKSAGMVGAVPAGDKDVAEVQAFFEKFKTLEANHHPSLAELFHDEGKLVMVMNVDGQTRTTALPLAEFKSQLPVSQAKSKARGSSSHYTEARFEPFTKERAVMIHAKERTADGVDGRISFHVRPVAGTWKIVGGQTTLMLTRDQYQALAARQGSR